MGFKAIYLVGNVMMICLFISPLVYPQTVAFEVTHRDQLQTLEVPIVVIEDTDYVDFPNLVERIGGSSVVLPKRMRIDLEGTTAWVGLNDNRVNALSIFPLIHNVISNENGIFIGLSDCVPFFSKAFRLSLSYTASTRTAESTPSDNLRAVVDGIVQDANGAKLLGVSATPKTYTPIRTVLLDPGHGGYEPGVEGVAGIMEKDVVLTITQKLQALLRDTHQLTAITMRDQDTNLSAQQRHMIVRNTQADLLVSIHVGGAFSEQMKGIAIYYPEPKQEEQGSIRGLSLREADFSKESLDIAEIISQSLIEETGAAFRGMHPIPNAMFNRSRRPSILIEVGCLTNPQDEALLNDDAYLSKIAIGIANGIQRLADRAIAKPAAPSLTNESIETAVPTLNNKSFRSDRVPL